MTWREALEDTPWWGVLVILLIPIGFIAGGVIAWFADDPRWLFLSVGAFILLYAG